MAKKLKIAILYSIEHSNYLLVPVSNPYLQYEKINNTYAGITFGIKYYFLKEEKRLRPHLGLDLVNSYVRSNIEYENSAFNPNTTRGTFYPIAHILLNIGTDFLLTSKTTIKIDFCSGLISGYDFGGYRNYLLGVRIGAKYKF